MAGRKDQTDTALAGPRRSRRMLLAGGTGALAVLAAEALGRPAPAAAANGGNVILGQNNTETAATLITNSTSNDDALGLVVTGAGVGLSTTSDSGRAVDAFSASGTGLRGQSGSPVSGFPPVTNGYTGWLAKGRRSVVSACGGPLIDGGVPARAQRGHIKAGNARKR